MRKSINKKYLYLILGVVVICICGLTIVYAALSVTLNIMGNAQINSANWGIEIKEYEMTSSDISSVKVVLCLIIIWWVMGVHLLLIRLLFLELPLVD